MAEISDTVYCTWCGAEIDPETVTLGSVNENPVGRCDDDGIVFVTSDPEEAGNSA